MNKRLIGCLLAGLFFIPMVHAQKEKLTSAIQSYKRGGELNDAKSLIEDCTKDEVTSIDPKTWAWYGLIYNTLFHDSGRSADKVPNSLTLAVQGYFKSYTLDTKKKFGDEIENGLQQCYNDNFNLAIEPYTTRHFDTAYTYFRAAYDINMFLNKNFGDPVDSAHNIGYYTAFTAYQVGKLDEAKMLFNELLSKGYEKDEAAFRNFSALYMDQKDNLNAIKTIQQGELRFPASEALLIDEINLYIQSNKTQQAVDKLTQAIHDKPDSLKYYYVLGQKYEDLKQPDKAADIYNQLITLLQAHIQKSGGKASDYGTLGSAYERLKRYSDAADAFAKAIVNSKTDPEKADYNFKTGAMYFNQAVVLDKKRESATPADSKKIEEQMNALFNQATPFLEAAHQLDPKNRQTLEALKQLYGTLNMVDKYKAIKAELDALDTK